MNRIMIWVIIVALVLILLGFNGVASSLLNGMLSVIKWFFILGGVVVVYLIILGTLGKKK